MTDEDAEALTPAQERVRSLLLPFREQTAPAGAELTRAVSHKARWQRPLRRVLLAVGTVAAALAGGLGSLARGGRGR